MENEKKIKHRPDRRKYDVEELKRLAETMTVPEIAKHFNEKYINMYLYLQRYDIKAQPSERYIVVIEDMDELRKKAKMMTLTELANEYHINVKSMWRYLKKNDVVPKKNIKRDGFYNITEKDLKDIKKAMKENASIYVVAQKYNISKYRLERILKDNQIKNTFKKHLLYEDVPDEELIEKLKNKSVSRVACDYKGSKSSLSRHLRERGINLKEIRQQ